MADTDFVPDDGVTAGSRTTPGNVPPMRQAAATARELLTRFAAKQWQVDANTLEVRDGTITNKTTKQKLTYADLAKSKEVAEAFKQPIESEHRADGGERLEGDGHFDSPADLPRSGDRDSISFPRTSFARTCSTAGSCVRPRTRLRWNPSTCPAAKAMKDVVVVHEGEFVGFAAPSLFRATQALEAAAKTAAWKTGPLSRRARRSTRISRNTPGRTMRDGTRPTRRALPTRPRLSAPRTRWPTSSTRRWSRGPASRNGRTTS